MKTVISLKSTPRGFKVAFSYILNYHEYKLRDCLKSEKSANEVYSFVSKNDYLLSKWNDESIFSQSEISETEIKYLINNFEKLAESNIEIRLPLNFKRTAKMEIRVSKSDKKMSSKISIDGVDISEDEIGQITSVLKDIIFFNGKWVIVDSEMIKKIRANECKSFIDVVKILQDKQPIIKADNITVKNIPIACDFKGNTEHFAGVLKPYQQQAVKMLYSSLKCNRNVLLADDMGLGKTITIVSLINMLNNDGVSPNLVIVPKSLTGNWENEIKKFAPLITCRVVGKELGTACNTYITTYGNVLHNAELFQSVNWNLVVIDEAQNIKNNATAQSKVVCGLQANHKIAMTGTPIENSLMDLWGIFQFLEPSLLGDENEFKKIRHEENNYKWLQQLVEPHFIRRVKSDKNLGLNLPDKKESIIYCDMSPQQIAFYNSVIDEFKKECRIRSNNNSRSTILKYINLLKLICGHPAAACNDFKGKVCSGKFEALKRHLESIGKQKVIVFTQHTKIAEMLDEFLADIYGSRGLVINGKLSAKQRTKIANEFQSGNYPYIILTLKAGNAGITLTRSCNVVHFDRWWNPSVENQATDRSHRIGQENDVNVVKLVMKGTLEERINDILQEKNSLFDKIVNPLNMSPKEFVSFAEYNKKGVSLSC